MIVDVPLPTAEANRAEEAEPQLEAALTVSHVEHVARADPTGSLTAV